MKRTDIIVDYGGEQFVIELKIWRGPKYHAAGEAQIAEYLDYYELNTGSFGIQREVLALIMPEILHEGKPHHGRCENCGGEQ